MMFMVLVILGGLLFVLVAGVNEGLSEITALKQRVLDLELEMYQTRQNYEHALQAETALLRSLLEDM